MNSGHLPRALRSDLAWFAAITFLITVIGCAVLIVSGADIRNGPGRWVFGVATAGPSLAALVVYFAWSRRRLRVARQPLSAPWLWAPAALLIGALPTVVANLLVKPDSFAFAVAAAPEILAGFGGALMFTILFLIAGPIAEEFGWRGFIQPRLRLRWGLVRTSVILGLAWALWHVPLYLVPGTGQYETGLISVNSLIFFVSCVPLSLSYLFVTERLGGRVWAAILLHFSSNAISAFFPSDALSTTLLQLGITFTLAALLLLVWGPSRNQFLSPGLSTAEATKDLR